VVVCRDVGVDVLVPLAERIVVGVPSKLLEESEAPTQ
jgi:hypothetical protein